jgi:hypothetical protein
VAQTGRDTNHVVLLRRPRLARDRRLRAPLDDEEALIDRVNLGPDVLIGRERHGDDLDVVSREQDAPKVAILFGEFLDVRAEWLGALRPGRSPDRQEEREHRAGGTFAGRSHETKLNTVTALLSGRGSPPPVFR